MLHGTLAQRRERGLLAELMFLHQYPLGTLDQFAGCEFFGHLRHRILLPPQHGLLGPRLLRW